jgi:4-hydroxybenzoate polyprenyltransferase
MGDSMRPLATPFPATLHVLMTLGRVSNLPTVWSNCVAGWWLGSGGSVGRLLTLLLAASCLYLGGMFLNDAFDADFDRQNRVARPIPRGVIGEPAVWRLGLAWLGSGFLLTLALGTSTAILAGLLVGSILVYNAVHKVVALSPLLMGGCRFLLYLMAGTAGVDGITGSVIWPGLAMGLYVAGLSFIARKETSQARVRYWPCALLAAPWLVAWAMNSGAYLGWAAFLALLLGLWVAWALRATYWTATRTVPRTVEGLLAGIVLVDFLAVLGGNAAIGTVLVLCFGAALLGQRFIRAT